MPSTQDHIRLLEEALLHPAVRRDRAAVGNLLAEDFVEFGSSGRVWTRDQMVDFLASGTSSPVRIDDFNCVFLAETVALVTYRAMRSDTPNGGETSSLRSSIWVRKCGGWQCRFHQGTRSS